jgi:hypothetical protein
MNSSSGSKVTYDSQKSDKLDYTHFVDTIDNLDTLDNVDNNDGDVKYIIEIEGYEEAKRLDEDELVFDDASNSILNSKGADAYKSTGNPILDLFTETGKKIPDNIKDFILLVRRIEAAKNHNPEMFIRLLKMHRLIEKGNGIKGIYYISMMILKEEDPEIYKKVLSWSYQYPKDILRLAKLSSMFGPSEFVGKGNTTKVTTHSRRSRHSAIRKTHSPKEARDFRNKFFDTIISSSEIELYSQLLVDTMKKIITGKLYDSETNLMLFKYLSYETGHFALETKAIWKRVSEILESDPVIKAAYDEYQRNMPFL